MARPGDVITNPITGETITFLRTGAETQGELLQFEMHVAPGGEVAAEHIHPSQAEHFRVRSGRVCLSRSGKKQTIDSGQEATIAPGMPHVWWNAGDEEADVLVELRPAAPLDDFLTSLFALARDGKTDDQGMPSLLQIAVMVEEYDDVIFPSSPPRPVQKLLFGVLAPLARALGYQADYPYPEEQVAEAVAG